MVPSQDLPCSWSNSYSFADVPPGPHRYMCSSLQSSGSVFQIYQLRKTTLLTLHKGDTYTNTEKKKEIHKEVNKRKEEEHDEVEGEGERD